MHILYTLKCKEGSLIYLQLVRQLCFIMIHLRKGVDFVKHSFIIITPS